MTPKSLRRLCMAAVAVWIGAACAPAWGEDPGDQVNRDLAEWSGNRLRLRFEERTRWEEKDGVSFGKAVNQQDMLSRIRVGVQVDPTEWMSVSVLGQDSRVPFYGTAAPNTMRDTMDLQEGYVELFGRRKTGFGAMFGRRMLDYGDSRIIGTPQWSNVARTYDNTRVYYRTAKARFEVLMVSPVKVRVDDFNKPEPGDRIWGTYNSFSGFGHGASLDVYALRHSQNRIGGWSGAGTLGTNSFGARLTGPMGHGFIYNVEGVGQTGHAGALKQRAYAWFGGASRKFTALGRPLATSAEYKVASGTAAGADHSGTFDQLSPANHDKFGHEDLFGWRNLKTFKGLATWNVLKAAAVNVMYTDHRLFSASDALYNGQGSSIAIAKRGDAGTHVGQELDTFLTYKRGTHTYGAGFGHFFRGGFIENTTPHVNPRYFYVFQQYTLK